MDRNWIADEKGHTLFELSLSLPIMIMLTLAMGALFLWSMKLFLYEMAEWSLQNELSGVMERVVGEARAADKIFIYRQTLNYDKYPYSGVLLLKPRCWPDTEKNRAYYFAHQPQYPVAGSWKIYHTSELEPITGDNMFGSTYIQKFHCEFIPPARLRIEIKASAPVSKYSWLSIDWHSLELKTEIFLPEMMKNAEPAPASTGN